MAKELIGTLTLEKGERAVRTEEGKKLLINNLFDGLAGKKVKVTVEEVVEEEETEEEVQEEETTSEETAQPEEGEEPEEETED
jgi:hypothetical protein